MPPGRRYSRKREAILRLLQESRQHPSAEWIYGQLKPQFPDLSLATVYRNLALFREEGAVASVANVRGQERYDGTTTPHPHFICDHCGAVIDVEEQGGGQGLDDNLAEKMGFQVRCHDLIFHGVCDKCIVSKQAG